jgi:type II secretory pathway pseudopilin PulG
LIELIVVLAIFSIILIAAMSFLQPVSKIMISTQTQEESAAVANGISNFISGELASGEYVLVSNNYPCDESGNVDTAIVDAAVLRYANDYYSGVVRAKCDPASPRYASGTIHVMLIGQNNGLISTMEYDNVRFGTDGNEPSDTGCTLGTSQTTKCAVNAAYYDKYDIRINHGTLNNESEFGTSIGAGTNLADNFNSDGANFSIFLKPKESGNASWVKDLSCIHHCSFTLVNVAASASTSKHYYTARKIESTDPLNPAPTFDFVDVMDSSSPVHHNVRQVDYQTDGNDKGYMIIYSYGIEIDTNETATP